MADPDIDDSFEDDSLMMMMTRESWMTTHRVEVGQVVLKNVV